MATSKPNYVVSSLDFNRYLVIYTYTPISLERCCDQSVRRRHTFLFTRQQKTTRVENQVSWNRCTGNWSTLWKRIRAVPPGKWEENASEESLKFTLFYSFQAAAQLKDAKIKVYETDRYGRKVAKVYVGRRCMNKAMLSEGLAWHYKDYSNSAEYSQLEESARSQKKGVFRQKNPTPPWEWRKEQKKMKKN